MPSNQDSFFHTTLRLPLFILAAVVVNLLLFYFIQQMVSSDQSGISDYEDIQFVDFVRLREEEPPPERKRREEKPPEEPPEEKDPPPPEIPEPQSPEPKPPKPNVPQPNIDIPLGIDGVPYVGDFMKSAPDRQPQPPAPDTSGILTEVEPTVRIPPQYPPRALRAGIEGSATVEFTIATDGSVKNPEIVSADPENIFDDAVLRAIRRWKFEPEKIDGQIVERRARQTVRFKLQ